MEPILNFERGVMLKIELSQIMTGMPWGSFKDFRCQRCGERPWQENDRILTNSGFYVVESREERQECISPPQADGV
jgi:hypothetical protein